jgi:CheY-like chemotaxis protein
MRCTSEVRCLGEGGRPAAVARGRGLVLVVDDDAVVREMIALVLRLEGFATLQAVDGMDALLALRTGPLPDAIVLDLEMPVMPGWEFRAAQLRDPALARIPVVVVSSSTEPVQAERRLGKPFEMEDLLRAVREVVDARVR